MVLTGCLTSLITLLISGESLDTIPLIEEIEMVTPPKNSEIIMELTSLKKTIVYPPAAGSRVDSDGLVLPQNPDTVHVVPNNEVTPTLAQRQSTLDHLEQVYDAVQNEGRNKTARFLLKKTQCLHRLIHIDAIIRSGDYSREELQNLLNNRAALTYQLAHFNHELDALDKLQTRRPNIVHETR